MVLVGSLSAKLSILYQPTALLTLFCFIIHLVSLFIGKLLTIHLVNQSVGKLVTFIFCPLYRLSALLSDNGSPPPVQSL